MKRGIWYFASAGWHQGGFRKRVPLAAYVCRLPASTGLCKRRTAPKRFQKIRAPSLRMRVGCPLRRDFASAGRSPKAVPEKRVAARSSEGTSSEGTSSEGTSSEENNGSEGTNGEGAAATRVTAAGSSSEEQQRQETAARNSSSRKQQQETAAAESSSEGR